MRSRDPAWPIKWLLVGYPLWWALGLADFMWIILAVPMAVRMIYWRRHGSRQLQTPPGFGLWLLFLACALAGAATLGLVAPGTLSSSVLNRVLSYGDRTASYLGITVLLLYAGNLTEDELPRRRLAWMLGLVAIYATVGGIAAMVKPDFQFSSPLGVVLPQSVQSNAFVHVVTHPALAQIQNVLGGPNARPQAPFDYTNTWGECLTLLMPWLLVAGWYAGTRRRRRLTVAILIVAAIPLLYSLNRTAWVGAGLGLAFLLVRVATKNPSRAIATLCTGLAVGAIVVFATPVPSLIGGRLSNGGSANLRATLDGLAVRDALSSPVIGYGDTRKQTGSLNSIARGPTAKCPLCGQLEVGSTGQLWLLLVSNGIVGALLYVAFFVSGIWRFRRDRTPYGRAGLLVLVLSLLYLFSYDAVPAPLGFTMLAYALLWRNDMLRRAILAAPRLDRLRRGTGEQRELEVEAIA